MIRIIWQTANSKALNDLQRSIASLCFDVLEPLSRKGDITSESDLGQKVREFAQWVPRFNIQWWNFKLVPLNLHMRVETSWYWWNQRMKFSSGTSYRAFLNPRRINTSSLTWRREWNILYGSSWYIHNLQGRIYLLTCTRPTNASKDNYWIWIKNSFSAP